ncbi:MAG: hypothetical protein PHP86_16355 [Nevskiales bacterium]|nr:hypothetical protein [Nevskiales bacterium]
MNMPNEDFDPLLRRLRELPLEQAPERDLWPGIAARLAPRRRHRPWGVWAMAASVVLAVVVGVLIQRAPDDVAGGAEQARIEPPAAAAVQPRVAGIVTPQPRALIKANLAIARDAERQLRHALSQDPQSESLQRLIDATQRQQAELKQQLRQVVSA